MAKPEDIEALNSKIEAFKEKGKNKKADADLARPTGNAAKGFQFSIELISGVFIGSAIGYFLDFVFNTTPWILALCTIFGGAAGVLNVYKSAQKEDEK